VLSEFTETIRFTAPGDSTIPGALQNLEMFASFQNVLFVFDNGTDNDLAVYEYELYEEDDIVYPNTPPYALKSGATVLSTGAGNSSVFAVPVEGSYIDVENDNIVVQKNFFGRVRAKDTSGNTGAWTSIVKTDPSTPLIDSQYIVSLTADKIKAGEIESAAIILGGANPINTIIKSKTYDTSSGAQGWYIRGDGHFSLGGPNGITYNNSTITIGSAVQVQANLAADSISVGSGQNQLNINDGINGGAGGMTLGDPTYNYWYANGNFRLGNATNYVIWNGTSLSIKGAITADSGTFTGTVSGSTITGGSININSGTFSVNSSGTLSASSATITGAITASSGSFSGTITSGGAHFGVMVPGNGYYKGINLSPNSSTQFQSCFIRGDGGEVYFRADNGSQWIKFENGTVQINAVGFSVNGSSATFSGSITAGTITGTTINGSTITADSSILVGSSTSLGYLKLATNDNVIVNGMKFQNRQYAGWNASFYPYADAVSDLSVVTSPNLGVYRWDNIYYVGSISDQSDMRSKNTIEDSDLGLNFINMLRPVSYFKNAHKKIPREDDNGNYLRDESENMICDIIPGKRRHYGLIAQEVRQVISDLGKTSMDFSGWGQHDPDDPESEQTLSYLAFIAPAIKAIQELSSKIDELESRMV
jgi:hypothetical protein